MPRANLTLGLLALALYPAAARAAIVPRVGDYLDTAYITRLQKTHSPFLAAAEDAHAQVAQMVSVQAQGRARRFAQTFNWHDGKLLFVLQHNGTIRREMAWGPDPATALRITSREAFCLMPLRGSEHCYRYVGRADAFITRIALAGQYVDRQGATYQFSPDGRAHFPGYDFTYTLMLEQNADAYDFFAVGTEGRFMAFKRVGEMMTLYPVGPGHGGSYGTPDFTHKLAVLREQPSARILASN